MATFDKLTYTPTEQAEISQWLQTSTRLSDPSTAGSTILSTLNTHLETRTTLLGSKPSTADVELYKALAPKVQAWSAEERTGKDGYPNIVRHLDFVQNSPLFTGGLDGIDGITKVVVNKDEILYVKPPVDAKAEKERLKKEKAAAAAGGDATLTDRTKDKAASGSVVDTITEKLAGAKDTIAGAVASVAGTAGAEKPKKEKKEKAPKPQKAPAVAAPLSPCLIDLRVGHILKCIKHPEADSLFVSTIAMGDPAGTDDTSEYEGQVVRTVCSGLNGLVPLEEMQGRKVITVCNLKPVKMRGVKSCAMVLAASPRLKEGEEDNHAGPVELVTPPEGVVAGERVYFEGWQGEPEKLLNPKKKVWEIIQPGFTTTSDLEVAFDAGVVKELSKEGEEPKTGRGKLVVGGKPCTVKSLTDGIVR